MTLFSDYVNRQEAAKRQAATQYAINGRPASPIAWKDVPQSIKDNWGDRPIPANIFVSDYNNPNPQQPITGPGTPNLPPPINPQGAARSAQIQSQQSQSIPQQPIRATSPQSPSSGYIGGPVTKEMLDNPLRGSDYPQIPQVPKEMWENPLYQGLYKFYQSQWGMQNPNRGKIGANPQEGFSGLPSTVQNLLFGDGQQFHPMVKQTADWIKNEYLGGRANERQVNNAITMLANAGNDSNQIRRAVSMAKDYRNMATIPELDLSTLYPESPMWKKQTGNSMSFGTGPQSWY